MAFNTYYPMAYQPPMYAQQPIYQPQAGMQPTPMTAQTPTATPTATQSGILWVGSEAEAQAYPLAPNNAVALWDSTRPTIYLKQADASGKPTLKIYDLAERAETAKNAPVALREGNDTAIADIRREIKEIWACVEDLRSDVRAGKRTTRKREVTEDDAE